MKYVVLLLVAALAACGDSSDSASDAGDDEVRAAGIVFINEVMPSNTAACADPFGEYDDWAELYNSSDVDFDLAGYSVSDDATMPGKGPLQAGIVVPAHGYTVLWFDDQVQGVDHLPFKLDADGEEITLYAPDGSIVDTLAFGAATTDVSFARVPDGTGEFVSCATSTCGASNGTACVGVR